MEEPSSTVDTLAASGGDTKDEVFGAPKDDDEDAAAVKTPDLPTDTNANGISSEGDADNDRAALPQESEIQPQDCDVLFGRGRPFILHPGNVKMKEMIVGLKTKYQNSSKDAKGRIVARVIKRIKTSGGPGQQVRFLRSKSQTNLGPWEVATNEQVKKKIGHILRSKFELRCVPKPPPAPTSAPLPAATPQELNFSAANLNVPGTNQLGPLNGPLTPVIPIQAVHPAAAALLQMTTPVNPILAIASHPGWLTPFAASQQLVGIPAGAFGGIPNTALGAALQQPSILLQQQPAFMLPQQPAIMLPQQPAIMLPQRPAFVFPQQQQQQPPQPQQLATLPAPEAVHSAAGRLSSETNSDRVNVETEFDSILNDIFDE